MPLLWTVFLTASMHFKAPTVQVWMHHYYLYPLPLSRNVGHCESSYNMAEGLKRWRGGPSIGGPVRYITKHVKPYNDLTTFTATATLAKQMPSAAMSTATSATLGKYPAQPHHNCGKLIREATTNLPCHPANNSISSRLAQQQFRSPNYDADHPTTVQMT